MLSMDVMKTLGELGVALPTSEEGVKSTVEELKTKLSYYKDNQVRVTQEVATPLSHVVLGADGQNIDKAMKDNEEIERKQMAAFNEKKEADLSGRKNRPARKGTPDRKGTPSSGDRKPRTPAKEKVNGNGNHDSDNKPESQKTEDADVEVAEEKDVVDAEGETAATTTTED